MSVRPAWCLFLGLVLIAAVSCESGDKKQQATPTRPIPTPVEFAQQPFGNYKLGDPTLYGGDDYGVGRHFDPLPGATVDAGRLGGSIYQIEVPDQWNGRLVLHVPPPGPVAKEQLTLSTFPIRSYLVRNGFAWATSSGSSNLGVFGTLADEMAALWDFFVQQHGRPQWTYITGFAAPDTRIAAARYPDRIDGALTICGQADDFSVAFSDVFVAGAFAAGVSQAEFDTTETSQLIAARILPSLDDPVVRKRFEDIAIDLSGGPRPFAREGLKDANGLLNRAAFYLGVGFFDNEGRLYHLRGATGISDDEFNRGVVRRRRGNPDLFHGYTAGAELSHDLKVPLLTINTTGDPVAPIRDDQVLRQEVTSAGKGDLLVQRTVQDPYFCGLQDGEWDRGFADLVDWVEQGTKPDGEDLLADDLSEIGERFTPLPRLSSPQADAVPGTDQHISLSGKLTLDGNPVTDGSVAAFVLMDGVLRSCMYYYSLLSNADPGRYELQVAADAETPGCGVAGAQVYLVLYSTTRRQSFVSGQALDWPSGTADVMFDGAFSSEHPVGAGVGPTLDVFFGKGFFGVVLDASGEKMPPGTLVEAYIGDTRCGRYALPVVARAAGSTNWEAATYRLQVSGPELLAGCTRDAAISFRVNGKPVAQTARNTIDFFAQELDLKVKE